MSKADPKPQASVWGKRLGWGITVTFLVLWSFVLGVLVGQGSILAPRHLQAVQEFMGLGAEPEPETVQVLQTDDDTEMHFYKGIKGAEPPKLPPVKSPVPKPAAESGKGWTVQVASFREQHVAENMVSQLRKDQLPAYMVRSQVKNVGLRFRVRVGPYEDRGSADRMAAMVRSQYKRAGLVLRQE